MFIILSILFVGFVGFFAFIAMKSKRDYSGFASKTRAKVWRGEISRADIKDLENSIEQDARNKAGKSTSIPL